MYARRELWNFRDAVRRQIYAEMTEDRASLENRVELVFSALDAELTRVQSWWRLNYFGDTLGDWVESSEFLPRRSPMSEYFHLSPRGPESLCMHRVAIDIFYALDVNVMELLPLFEEREKQNLLTKLFSLAGEVGISAPELEKAYDTMDRVGLEEMKHRMDSIGKEMRFLTDLDSDDFLSEGTDGISGALAFIRIRTNLGLLPKSIELSNEAAGLYVTLPGVVCRKLDKYMVKKLKNGVSPTIKQFPLKWEKLLVNIRDQLADRGVFNQTENFSEILANIRGVLMSLEAMPLSKMGHHRSSIVRRNLPRLYAALSRFSAFLGYFEYNSFMKKEGEIAMQNNIGSDLRGLVTIMGNALRDNDGALFFHPTERRLYDTLSSIGGKFLVGIGPRLRQLIGYGVSLVDCSDAAVAWRQLNLLEAILESATEMIREKNSSIARIAEFTEWLLSRIDEGLLEAAHLTMSTLMIDFEFKHRFNVEFLTEKRHHSSILLLQTCSGPEYSSLMSIVSSFVVFGKKQWLELSILDEFCKPNGQDIEPLAKYLEETAYAYTRSREPQLSPTPAVFLNTILNEVK